MVLKALVLAAGKSNRFGTHKMLYNIEGKPLLGQVLERLKQSGIKTVYIAIGYRGNEIMQKFGAKHEGLDIVYLPAKNWEKGNLHSFLAAKGTLNENFLLCMGDHIFDMAIVKKLINEDLDLNPEGTVLYLAVDRNFYSEDDTHVLEANGKIIRIGKHLKTYNCTDTGFFLCSPYALSYAEIVAKRGASELAECVQYIADKGKARVIDVTGYFWRDVDTKEDIKRVKLT